MSGHIVYLSYSLYSLLLLSHHISLHSFPTRRSSDLIIGDYSVISVSMFWEKIRLSIFYLASYYYNPILFFALKWSVFYTCHFFVFVIYFFIFPVFLFNTNASKTCTSNDPEVKMINIFFQNSNHSFLI